MTETLASSTFKQLDVGAGNRNWDKDDCTVRALVVVSGLSYNAAWELLYSLQGKHRCCSFKLSEFLRRDSIALGVVRYIPFPAKHGESRMTPLKFIKQYPKGRFILRTAHHVVAVKDGLVMDLWNCTQRCVYGAWEMK